MSFQYSTLAPLAAETFHTEGEDLVWTRTWLSKEAKSETAVETASAPLVQATQAVPESAVPQFQAGEAELGEFLSLEEPQPAAEPEPASDEDKDEPVPSQLAWDKASSRIRSPLLRLHSEIVNFCRALSPTAAEVDARHAAIARITAHICAIWPSADVQVFGSVLTGLFVPSSDVDLVIMNSGCVDSSDIRSALYKLSPALRKAGAAHSIQVIAKAKVPIIKFKETVSNFDFDISFEVADGPVAGRFVAQLMQQLPPMKPLILVLKIFLQQREFNEVYKGGIGSYGLIVMVAAFLLLYPARAPAGSLAEGEICNLGELLVDFFRLYGRTMNTNMVGVSCRNNGRFFAKLDRADTFWQEDRPGMLALEDPRDPTNDLAKGSYNFERQIRPALDFAYQQLSAPSRSDESILARIVRQDAILLGRDLAAPSEPGAAKPSRHRSHAEPAAVAGSKRRALEEEFPVPKRQRGQLYASTTRPASGAGHSSEVHNMSFHTDEAGNLAPDERWQPDGPSPASEGRKRKHSAGINGKLALGTSSGNMHHKHTRRREREEAFDAMPAGRPDQQERHRPKKRSKKRHDAEAGEHHSRHSKKRHWK